MKEMSVGVSQEELPAKEQESSEPERKLWNPEAIQGALRNPAFLTGAAAFGAILFAFWPLLQILGRYWFDFDSYYAHGLLVPLASAYIIWARWPEMKETPVKGSWVGMVALVPLLYLAYIASRTEMPLLISVTFIASLMAGVVFVAGWAWLKNLLAPILFLILGLPILDRWIDQLTFQLQLLSTSGAFQMLELSGLDSFRLSPTVIELPHYTLNIAEACSGLKTTIAVSATVVFFMVISKLRWWANAILATTALPLSVLVNSLRITMIGHVGNSRGEEAAITFHDWSGYIALGICFLVLMKLTHGLERFSK